MPIEAVDDRIRTEEMKNPSSRTRTERTPPAAVDANNPRPRVPVGAPLAVGIVKEAPFHPSPSLDERDITGLENYEQFKTELQPAVSALSVATEALKAVDKAHLQLLKDGSKTVRPEAARHCRPCREGARPNQQALHHGARDAGERCYRAGTAVAIIRKHFSDGALVDVLNTTLQA